MQANTEKTEIALQQASTEISEFVANAESEVAAIEEQYGSVVPDASSKDGYNYCKSVRRDLMPIKSGLEDARKKLKAPILAAGKLVDSNLKPLADRIETVMTPFVDAYREVDAEKKRKEEARQAQIQNAFDSMTSTLETAIGSTSTVIEGLIDELADHDFNPEIFQERTNEAVSKHAEIMDKLSGLLTQAIAMEEQQRRQEELEARERAIREKEEAEERRQAAEKQRLEREQIAKEAAEKARVEAEEKYKRQLAEQEEKHKQYVAATNQIAQESAQREQAQEVQPEQEAQPKAEVVQEQRVTRQFSIMELNAMDNLAAMVEEKNKPWAKELREFVEAVKANNLRKAA
ncbi:hypothetical protein JC525_09185 [Alteromonas sp. IB21]|uniref:hypothetical protein n=1 Tax=Alteromonas sp. IB21 TaxID=2779369 RepID=UPI0018E7A24C|nr:hypothetical protein [Alteromonas sp. IB21]MBJ2129110.1 hypothetical protein [Alteromonas sp. IB21]